ncbi:hypothetical protein AALM99_00320 [Lactococcus muris]|uniref:N-acetyltransferase domain-containing protein n=1 Tax=Lactococcus muris TaxID=2941330 RepID=A0ABV4D732_9LACT
MQNDSAYRVRTLVEEDIPQIVDLFNKNKVYQFQNGAPVTLEDFCLTLAIKETSHFYVLEKNGKIIGTTAFFKFITFGVLPVNESYSGFLLIDVEHRTGAAISLLHKEVLFDIVNCDFHTHFTEISRYNKASLTLSKRNGFSKFEGSYEDMNHCYLLRSLLPKVLKAFKFTGDLENKYDINTFKIIEQTDKADISTLLTEISGKKMVYRCFSKAYYPFDIQLDLFRLYIFKENKRYYLRCEFYSEQVSFVKARIGNLKYVKLSRKKNQIEIKKAPLNFLIQGVVYTDIGEIRVQLHYREPTDEKINIQLNQSMLSYRLVVNRSNGSLFFIKNDKAFIEDTYLLFARPEEVKFLVEEYENKISIRCIGEHLDIHKVIELYPNRLEARYYIKEFPAENKEKVLKYGMKILEQDYLIQEEGATFPYVPGQLPNELDDFVSAHQFKTRDLCYLIISEKLKLTYSTQNPTSNQMQYRPLSFIKLDNFRNVKIDYSIKFEKKATQNFNIDFREFRAVNLNWKSIRNLKAYTAMEDGAVNYRLDQKRRSLFYRIDMEEGKLYIGDSKNRMFSYKVLEFSWSCSSRVEAWIHDAFYAYKNKGPIWEARENILIVDRGKNRYLSITAEQGKIYSFKESNKIMIRCVIPNSSDIQQFIHFRQLKREEENDE